MLLKVAWDWALAGDDEPIPMADRPMVQDLFAESDAEALIGRWAGLVCGIASRGAPLYSVLQAAALSDADVAGAQLEPRRPSSRQPQGALEGRAARPHAHRHTDPGRRSRHDGLSAQLDPRLVRHGPRVDQQCRHLRPEPVGVLELHDAAAAPGAVRSWPCVAIDGGDRVSPEGQSGTQDEAGRPGADDEDAHVASFDTLKITWIHQR